MFQNRVFLYLRSHPRLTRCTLTNSVSTRNLKTNLHCKETPIVVLTSLRFASNVSGSGKNLSSIVEPIQVKPCNDPDGINIGEELTGLLKRESVVALLNKFYRETEIKRLAAENGLDNKLFHQAYVSFRMFCVESENLPVDLHIVLSDIIQESGHVHDLFPYFLQHAKTIFPHLECMEDLQKISDLRLPANWYPEARAIQRKIVFHSGPTNSGKTYHALERFFTAKSGIYCGPLRLLATEVYHKSNAAGTPCDLITGEERCYVSPDGESSNHVSCTVEMTSVTTPYEVAVIDEIQMLRDAQRGWAWTRAFFGLCAQEIHVCGEESAIEIIKDLALAIGDEVEVRKYKRLTELKIQNRGLDSLDKVDPHDAVVCFGKNDIYHVSRQLEKRGIDVAVLYGTLPPGTKLAQAQKFNDPKHPCKVLVSTDAIGMGLNLNIKRVVFYSLVKPTVNEKGEKEIDVISPSTALQIAGRAGRFGSEHQLGEVTTFKSGDLPLLKQLLATPIEDVQQVGLHPTAEQIELFAYHLPKASLSNLIDIFVTLCKLDNDRYFMCNVEDFKFLADMIEHIPLSLRVRYIFCCAPIPKKQPFVCTMFLKFARQYSRGELLTLQWLYRQIGWPIQSPKLISDLVQLEAVFDVLDIYLWLGYRFPDMFPEMENVCEMQKELDSVIQNGVYNITRLLRNSETSVLSGTPADSEDDDLEVKHWSGFRRKHQPRSASSAENNRELGEPFGHERKEAKKFLATVHRKTVEATSRLDTAYDSRLDARETQRRQSSASTDSKPSQSLTDELIRRGIVTSDMLDMIQREMNGGEDGSVTDAMSTERSKRKWKKTNKSSDDKSNKK